MSLQVSSNPFVGLRPFESNESLLFFGRQEQTLELLQRLHQHHFVAVVGSSGSGKSSLIRAGLIPSLKAGYLVDDRDRWMITIMKPGQSPLYNLANAIINKLDPDAGELSVKNLLKQIKEEGTDAVLNVIRNLWEEKNTNFFLLVDQFEELFRFSMEQKEAAKKDEAIDFVNIILELSRQTDVPIYVVITMRSDFIGDCSQFYGLPEVMNKSQYLVPRLNRVQLKNAIEGPVKLYGQYINPALISKLLNDAVTVKDELPLLQHALMRVWDHEKKVDNSGELDLKDYESIGGIEKALSNHADEALKGMNDEELNLTKKIFQALTAIDENGRKIRKPAYLKELEAITGATRQQLLAIVKRFIEDKRSFLVINKAGEQDDEVIDISHESLIRQWGTLSGWVDEEGESAKNYLRLVESAELHKDNKKDLLTGSELQIASAWYSSYHPSAVWANRYYKGFEESARYLNKSIQQKHLEEKKAKDRRKKQLLFTTGSALAIIILLVFFSIKQNNLRAQADREKRNAEDSAKVSREQRQIAYRNAIKALKAQQEADSQRDIARVSASEAILAQQNAESSARVAENALKSLKTESEKTKRQYNAFKLNALAYDWESKDATVALRLAEEAMQTDPDSIFFFTAQRIYERNTFYKTILKDTFSSSQAFAFSNDGKRALIKSYYRAKIWDLEAKEKDSALYIYINDLDKITFSPDLTKALISLEDIPTLWDINAKKWIANFSDSGIVSSYGFSQDGKNVYTVSSTGVSIWDMRGKRINHVETADPIRNVYVSSDATKILTESREPVSDSGYIKYKFWNGNNSKEKTYKTLLLSHRRFSRFGSAVSSDGKRMLFYSNDSTLKLWNIEDDKEKYLKTRSGIKNAFFNPDGTKVLATLFDNTALLWQANDTIKFIGHTGNINDIALSADETKILTASDDNTVRIWRADGTLISIFKAPGIVLSATFTADDSKILAGLDNGTIKTWNTPEQKFIGHTDEINLVAYSPDKTKLLTGSEDLTARLWDVAGNTITTLSYSDGVASVVFSHDGKKFLTAAGDSAMLWGIDGILLQSFTGHADLIQSVAFSFDNSKILTGSDDGTAKLWDLNIPDDSGKIIATHNEGILSVAFSRNGNILTGSRDSTAKLWSPEGKEMHLFKHSGTVYCVAFSPDGTKIITSSSDSTAILWSLKGDSLATFRHDGDIESVVFSPDGTKVLTGSSDYTAKLWGIDGTLIRTFKMPDNVRVRSIAFSPDGTKIFVGASDGIGRLYDIRTVQEFLKSDDIDVLTEDEKKKLGIK